MPNLASVVAEVSQIRGLRAWLYQTAPCVLVNLGGRNLAGEQQDKHVGR